MQKDINILYEDNDLLVLDKPAGITVNRSDTTTGEQTLQDWVEERYHISEGHNFIEVPEGSYELANKEAFYKRSGIVHRLDKETSGIILIAKTEDAFVELLREFREREVHKAYTALVHGKITPEEGEITVPLGRLPWNRKRFGVVAGGRDATTGYSVLRYISMKNEPLTLIKLFPKTGRTHQIRVHLKYMNRPIFSDALYGGRKTAREDRKILPRQFLHASNITFTHPKTHEVISFESPLSPELEEFLSKFTN